MDRSGIYLSDSNLHLDKGSVNHSIASSLIKTASGEYDHDLSVKSVFDGSNVNTLADWMKELYDADKTPAGQATDKNGRILLNGKAVVDPTAFAVTNQ